MSKVEDSSVATNATFLLNEGQLTAYKHLLDFLRSETHENFLLLGPAGSGKTTIIVSLFAAIKARVAFCAFTNKAASVLRDAAQRMNVNDKIEFNEQSEIKQISNEKTIMTFSTIHSLFNLQPYNVDYDRISYSSTQNGINRFCDQPIDIIVFDECSTISSDLYKFITEAISKKNNYAKNKLKCIYLGDFWQLPPVNEISSVVFDVARINWPIYKLSRVMRSNNDKMRELNIKMLSIIQSFAQADTQIYGKFLTEFPFNMIDNESVILSSNVDNTYKQMLQEKKSAIVITYSRENARKTNNSIQQSLDYDAKRPIIDQDPDNLIFYPGDRCCVDQPCSSYDILIHERIAPTDVDVKSLAKLGSARQKMYNGEIFEIISTRDVQVKTILNAQKGVAKIFDAQHLKMVKVGHSYVYELLHIANKDVKLAMSTIKKNLTKSVYCDIVHAFRSDFPLVTHGYCITLYKSQGSEWDYVICNLNSIYACVMRDCRNPSVTDVKMLFKATYTALSRASKDIFCVYKKFA